MIDENTLKRLKEIEKLFVGDTRKCIGKAIKSLESPPCEDAVRRADVISLANKGYLVSNSNYKSVCDVINALPSVIPTRPHGEWIEADNGVIHCSKCNEEAYWDTDYGQQEFDFCPYCGADMREVKADEDSN